MHPRSILINKKAGCFVVCMVLSNLEQGVSNGKVRPRAPLILCLKTRRFETGRLAVGPNGVCSIRLADRSGAQVAFCIAHVALSLNIV